MGLLRALFLMTSPLRSYYPGKEVPVVTYTS